MSSRPPANDVVEVTVLGPGRGECCVLHTGRGEWLVVDSCVMKDGSPAALAYLRTIGVPASAVRWIVATHWHDDHVRGLADLVEQCSNATVYQSAALCRDEFMRLAAIGNDAMIEGSSGVKEMWTAWTHLADSGRSVPHLVRADQRIYLRDDQRDPSCEIWSLSPSNSSMVEACLKFRSLIPKEREPKRAVPRPKRNPASVVAWVRTGQAIVLLGADLERSSDRERGWQAIVNSAGRPTDKAQLVKIPHHGSENAHDPQMWTELLVSDPYAAVTPFSCGSVRLPKKSDRSRIAELSFGAWLTRDTMLTRTIRRSRTVDKTFREVVRRSELLSVDPGRVTFRCHADNPEEWEVDAPDPAVRLT